MIRVVYWLRSQANQKVPYINDLGENVHVFSTVRSDKNQGYGKHVKVTDITVFFDKVNRDGELFTEKDWLVKITDMMITEEEEIIVLRNLHDVYNIIWDDEKARVTTEDIEGKGTRLVKNEILKRVEERKQFFMKLIDEIPVDVVLFYNVMKRPIDSDNGFYMILDRMVDEIQIMWLGE